MNPARPMPVYFSAVRHFEESAMPCTYAKRRPSSACKCLVMRVIESAGLVQIVGTGDTR